MRSQSDLVIAKYLKQALQACYRKDLVSAEEAVQQARRLAPEFYEVHRVEAWVKMYQGNVSGAYESYEAAIELAQDNHAPLLYWYAGFLMRYMEDTKTAITYFEKAHKLDPKSFYIQIELARSYLYMSEYKIAQSLLEGILDEEYNVSQRDLRKLHDLYLQVFERTAQTLASHNNFSDALSQLVIMKQKYESYHHRLIDDVMRNNLYKAVYTAELCSKNLYGKERETAKKIVRWLNATSKRKHYT